MWLLLLLFKYICTQMPDTTILQFDVYIMGDSWLVTDNCTTVEIFMRSSNKKFRIMMVSSVFSTS